MKSLGFIFLILFSVTSSAENIALGKKVTLHTPPNYTISTEAEDHLQLTDGKRTKGMWASLGSVTWQHRPSVTITIDLEKVSVIDKVSVSSGARKQASVLWPSEITVFTSEDGSSWRFHGDIVEQEKAAGRHPKEPEGNELLLHDFTSDSLGAPARYITIVGRGSSPYFTADEIEVTASPENSRANLPPADLLGVEAVQDTFIRHLTLKGVARRLQQDRAELSSLIEKSALSESQKNELRMEIKAIPPQQLVLGEIDPYKFRSIFPLTEEHRRLFEIQAKFWRLSGAKEPVVASFPRYDWLPHFHELQVAADTSAPVFEVKQLQGEKRSSSIIVSNPTSGPITFDISLNVHEADLPRFSLFSTVWTDTREGIVVADALLPLKAKDQFTVPAGTTTKVWLSFNSEGAKEGTVLGNVELGTRGFKKTIPVKIDVSPVALELTPFALGGFDYLISGPIYGITKNNHAAVLDLVKANGVNVAWLASGVLPGGNSPTMNTDFRELARRCLKVWPEAEKYMFFVYAEESFGGEKLGTPEFNAVISKWLDAMAKAFTKEGIPPEKLYLMTVDEPQSEKKAFISAEWAKAIIAAKSPIRTWTDPVWPPGKFKPHAYMELADIVSPNIQTVHRDGPEPATYFEKLRQSGKELWFYICSGPTRSVDPSYYRLAPWFAFKHKAVGVNYWAFSDVGKGGSWNEYAAARPGYCPFFLGYDTVDNSIHWEALLEGRSDYSLLHMVGKIAEAKNDPEAKQIIEDAAKPLLRYPNTRGGDLLVNGFWNEGIDNNASEEIRLRAISLLEKHSQPRIDLSE